MEGDEIEFSPRLIDQNQTRNGQQDVQPSPISRPPSIQTTSEDNQDIITAKDIGLISVFGLVLPSVDQGTDYNTSSNLINYEHKCRSVLSSSDNANECFIWHSEYS